MKSIKRNFSVIALMFASSALLVACNGDADTEEAATDDAAEDRVVVVHGDTLNSHEVVDAICVVNSRFEQGWRMVFRATVNDLNTGELIEDAEVRVVLEDGQEFDMELGPHGEETLLYTVGWTIPEDYATGTLEYEIIATVDGEEYTYEPFDVEPSKLTIIEPEEEQETVEG